VPLFLCEKKKSFVQENSLAEKSFAQNFRRDAQVGTGMLVDDGLSSGHNAFH
jgi:hypothetical protein